MAISVPCTDTFHSFFEKENLESDLNSSFELHQIT